MSKSKKAGAVWEDREVLFDLPFQYLRLRPGEKIFDRIEPIEDSKGNSGVKGRMIISNLRIIWHSLASPRINLSIGLNCVLNTSTKVVNSGLRGTTQALYALAMYKNNRYEFIFTNLSPNCVRHYTTVVGVHKAYMGSRMYRDLKLRGTLIHNKQLKMLPLEKVNPLPTNGPLMYIHTGNFISVLDEPRPNAIAINLTRTSRSNYLLRDSDYDFFLKDVEKMISLTTVYNRVE